DSLPESMGWDEAARLARLLGNDPSSKIAAALAGWDYAATRTELLLADLYDLTVLAHSDRKKGKPKPHPMRPVAPDKAQRRSPKRAAGVTDAQVMAAMAAAGHTPP